MVDENKNLTDILLDRLKCISERTEQIETKNKYFMILYGPPASGKTLGRKIGCHLLQEKYSENINVEQIINTFIDTNVDELTYNTKIDGKTVRDLLLENVNNLCQDQKCTEKYVHDNIEKFVESGFKIYKQGRADSLSELLFYFSVYLNKNIFIEMSSGDIDYLEKVINSLNYYGYIPIIIYPFVPDVKILYDRSIRRGLKEGRFLYCSKKECPHVCLETKMIQSHINFPNILEILKNNKIGSYLVYKYHSVMDLDERDKIEHFNYTDLSKFTLEEYFKNVGVVKND